MPPNIQNPNFDEPREQEGFRAQRPDARDYFDGESPPG
jgi:hypothetical protein